MEGIRLLLQGCRTELWTSWDEVPQSEHGVVLEALHSLAEKFLKDNRADVNRIAETVANYAERQRQVPIDVVLEALTGSPGEVFHECRQVNANGDPHRQCRDLVFRVRRTVEEYVLDQLGQTRSYPKPQEVAAAVGFACLDLAESGHATLIQGAGDGHYALTAAQNPKPLDGGLPGSVLRFLKEDGRTSGEHGGAAKFSNSPKVRTPGQENVNRSGVLFTLSIVPDSALCVAQLAEGAVAWLKSEHYAAQRRAELDAPLRGPNLVGDTTTLAEQVSATQRLPRGRQPRGFPEEACEAVEDLRVAALRIAQDLSIDQRPDRRAWPKAFLLYEYIWACNLSVEKLGESHFLGNPAHELWPSRDRFRDEVVRRRLHLIPHSTDQNARRKAANLLFQYAAPTVARLMWNDRSTRVRLFGQHLDGTLPEPTFSF